MKCSKHRCGAVCVCRGQMQRRKGPLHLQAQNKIGTSERDGFLARGTRHGPRDTGRPISICLINDTLYGIHAICGDLLAPSYCLSSSLPCRPRYSIRRAANRSVGRRLRLLVTRSATSHHVRHRVTKPKLCPAKAGGWLGQHEPPPIGLEVPAERPNGRRGR